MIKVNNLNEYQALSVMTNHALNAEDCEYCKLDGMCNCMSIKFCKLKISYEPEMIEKGKEKSDESRNDVL